MNKRYLMKWVALASLAVMMALVSDAPADPGQVHSGDFSIRPLVYHPAAIKGQMSLRTGAAGVESIRLTLDEALLGRSAFDSKEHWIGRIGEGSSIQTTVAFKLEGPTHGWYFVFVATSADGGQTLAGPIYKVKAPLAAIQAAAQSPLGTPPPTWKSTGSATLKAQ